MSAPTLRIDAPLDKLKRLQALRRQLAELTAVDAQRYRHDIAAWARDRLGVHLWSKQVEIAASVTRNRRTAVQSAAGIGKSFLAAVISLWWIDTHPPGEAIVVTTAPTGEQVGAILWEEIRKHHRMGDLPGTVQRGLPVRWVLDDGTLVGLGRKPADHSQSAFQGIHRRYVLVILDEAGGVAANLWAGAEAITTNEDCRILAIGNPDDSSSHFAGVCSRAGLWHPIKVSAFDTPNLTGEDIPHEMRMVLPSRQQIEDLKVEWGETNPLFIAKVLGEFADADDGLIPLSWIQAAQHRWTEWNASYDGTHQPPGRNIFGVDVARFGEDKTAIANRQGDVVHTVERFSKLDTVAVTGVVEARLAQHIQSTAVVDADGIGGSVVDLLRSHGKSVIAYSGNSATKRRDRTGTQRFARVRSAAWYNMRELLDPAFGSTVCLPPDNLLAADLSAPKWMSVTGNIIEVEKKIDFMKRLGHSPDTGDAVVQSFWVEPMGRPDSEQRSTPRARTYSNAVTWDNF
jgi:hypothetical protein